MPTAVSSALLSRVVRGLEAWGEEVVGMSP